MSAAQLFDDKPKFRLADKIRQSSARSADKVKERDNLLAQLPKRLMGRPSVYDPVFCVKAAELCHKGATNIDLADAFAVDVRTIVRWQVEHEDFCLATRVGKEFTDDRVERSLLERATGASWIETQAIKLKEVRINLETKERTESERVEIVKLQQSAPPDTQAAFIWLSNRRGKQWKQKQEIEHTGQVTLATLVETSMRAIEGQMVDVTPRLEQPVSTPLEDDLFS